MIPMLLKEIRLLLRSNKAFWFMLLTLLAVGGLFGFYWTVMSLSGGNIIDQRAMLGRIFFMMISVIQLCAMGLISALMAATAVTIERENNTLDLLVCTGIPRLTMLLGKWLATIFYQLVLLICLLPILALVFQLGGVALEEYFFAAGMIALTVLTYGMLGLAFSCRYRKSTSALVATVCAILFLSAGVPLLLALLDDLRIIHGDFNPTNSQFNLFGFLFWSVSPVLTWVNHISALERSPQGTGASLTASVYIAHAAFQGVLFLLSLLLAWRTFVRPQEDQAASGAKAIRRTTKRRVRVSRATRQIGDRQNPVYVKEARTGTMFQRHVLVRLGALCVFMSLFMIKPLTQFNNPMNDPNAYLFQQCGVYLLSIIILFLPIYAATALSREREERTMDLLRITPLPSHRIVWGKFLVVWRFAGLMALALIFVPFFFRELKILSRSPYSIASQLLLPSDTIDHLLIPAIEIALPVAAFSSLFIAVGIYFSARQRRSLGAISLTYAALLVLTILPLILGTLYHETHRAWLSSWGAWDSFFAPLDFLCDHILPLLSYLYYLILDNGELAHSYVFWDVHQNARQPILLWLLPSILIFWFSAFLLRAAARRLDKEKG